VIDAAFRAGRDDKVVSRLKADKSSRTFPGYAPIQLSSLPVVWWWLRCRNNDDCHSNRYYTTMRQRTIWKEETSGCLGIIRADSDCLLDAMKSGFIHYILNSVHWNEATQKSRISLLLEDQIGLLCSDRNPRGLERKISISETIKGLGPPLWSSSQSFWLLTQGSWVRFPALPDFSEQQWVWNGVHSASWTIWGATWKKQ
jgi:hypothetical protein